MERFMIGQFGMFDYKKQLRDFKDNFYGVEACLLRDHADITNLVHEATKGQFNICVHFPLRAGGWSLRDPQFLSKDDNIRRSSYDYAKEEIKFLEELHPKYVLFHYPKPVILDDFVDWTNWRFEDDTEYYFQSEYTFEEFKVKSEELFKWLDSTFAKNSIIPVLELDALNKYIYGSNLLETLLERYPSIKVCLDTGRLHLQDKLDIGFNSFEIIRKLAKYAEVIHLWNVKVNNNIEGGHFPVLPNLSKDDGWADIEAYLKIIGKENKLCKILFEHKSELINDEELDSCYRWVNTLLNT